MRPDGVYGNLSADEKLQDLWHVGSCTASQTFAMDFEFRGGATGGVDWDTGDMESTVQVSVRLCF